MNARFQHEVSVIELPKIDASAYVRPLDLGQRPNWETISYKHLGRTSRGRSVYAPTAGIYELTQAVMPVQPTLDVSYYFVADAWIKQRCPNGTLIDVEPVQRLSRGHEWAQSKGTTWTTHIRVWAVFDRVAIMRWRLTGDLNAI